MTTAPDTVPDLLNAIHALEPIIRKHADEAELTHRLSQPAVHAMASAGLFCAWVPRTLGGSEGTFAHLQVRRQAERQR